MRAVERARLAGLGVEGDDRGRARRSAYGDRAGVDLRNLHGLVVRADHVERVAVEARGHP